MIRNEQRDPVAVTRGVAFVEAIKAMTAIPQDVVDRMMVKCARRCCICRRFRPIKLQVHHIMERSQGGTNEEDNLIVICLSCHSDVHTVVPFARRFTPDELRAHRDALVALIAMGGLPADDTDDTDLAVGELFRRSTSGSARPGPLLPEAQQILLIAAASEGWPQGNVHILRPSGMTGVRAGNKVVCDTEDRRTQATYLHAVEQLAEAGLLRCVVTDRYEMTYEGYLIADELKSGSMQ